MATAPGLLSLEEYLRTSFHPDADYVDGEIEERHLGEYEHARLQFILAAIFSRNEREWNVRGVVEQRILVAPNRVRICDVCLIDRATPSERVLHTPPLLCVEILSPEDRLSRASVVLADYWNMGVRILWLLDPIRRIAYTYDAKGLQIINCDQLSVPGSPIQLSLTEAFAALD